MSPFYLYAYGSSGIVGTIRNVSCISAALTIDSNYTSGFLPQLVELWLLDEQGLEGFYNPYVTSVKAAKPGSYCRGGLTNTTCYFTTTGLASSEFYHFLISYPLNISHYSNAVDGFTMATFTSNSPGGTATRVVHTLSSLHVHTPQALQV